MTNSSLHTRDAEMASEEFGDNPYPFYDTWRTEAPVWYSATLKAHILSTYADVRRGFTDQAAFRQSPQFERGIVEAFGQAPLVAQDPPLHDRTREAFAPPFRPKALEEHLVPAVQRIVVELVDELKPGEPFELIGLCVRMASETLASLMGTENTPGLTAHYSEITRSFRRVHDNKPSPGGDPHRVAGTAILDYLHETRTEALKNPSGSLIDAIAESDDIDEHAIVVTCANVMSAGIETTAAGIGAAFTGILTHRDAFETVRADRSLLRRAFDEGLRWSSPVQMIGKQVVTPIELSGHEFQTGDEALLVLGSANRDPARYKDPEAYDLSRAIRDHVGFGAGLHLCLGAPVARLESQILMGMLFDKFPEMRLDPDQPPVRFVGAPGSRVAEAVWIRPS